jgi:hypothetical protein
VKLSRYRIECCIPTPIASEAHEGDLDFDAGEVTEYVWWIRGRFLDRLPSPVALCSTKSRGSLFSVVSDRGH